MRQKHTLIRDVVTGDQELMRRTEAIEVEIDWPDPSTLNLATPGIGGLARVGDWRVLNPPPMGWVEAIHMKETVEASR